MLTADKMVKQLLGPVHYLRAKVEDEPYKYSHDGLIRLADDAERGIKTAKGISIDHDNIVGRYEMLWRVAQDEVNEILGAIPDDEFPQFCHDVRNAARRLHDFLQTNILPGVEK